VKYNQNNFYLYPFFEEFTCRSDGQTHRRIFTNDGSKGVHSHKEDVPLLGFVHMAPRLGGQNPKKTHFWGVNRHFQAKLAKSKTRILSKLLLINSNHNDKDHQMPFVGGPNIRVTNPKWWTAAILKN